MKAQRSPFQTFGAFQAAARPLFKGTAGRRSLGSAPGSGVAPAPADAHAKIPAPAHTMLAELAEGPYLDIAHRLDASSLCRVDATCRLLRQLNRGHVGPWRVLGAHAFHGMELERDGIFENTERDDSDGQAGRMKLARVDWKGRYSRFRAEVPTFRSPFSGAEIVNVRFPDEVAYCSARWRTDLLGEGCEQGVYLEVEVLANADNLSLAVVDFEAVAAGGRSSVTFSPDTGAVIRERKVQEAPRKVEGAYIQPLPATTPGWRFEGFMGLYLRGGHLAFFRRCVNKGNDDAQPTLGEWETTGFITDLGWAEGKRLTPCLTFRDEGAYKVRIVHVSSEPPLPPARTAMAYQDSSWSGLDWEADQPAETEF